MTPRNLLLPVAAVLFAAAPSFAGKLKTWHTGAQAAYADARFENAVVSNQGSVRLARQLKPLAASRIDASHVWDTVEDKDGNLILATGGEGKLLKVAPAGEVTTLYENKSGPVLCLTRADDGSIYAGTGPDGRILHVTPHGEVKPLCATGESYVWALVAGPDGLVAATGPHGRVLKITPDGKVSTFYQTKQEHVLCLAAGEGGMLYAGTDKQGLIYRIDAKGKGYVLYQAPQGEIRSLLVTPDAVYAGTAAPTKKRGLASTSGGGGGPTVSLTALPKPNPLSSEPPPMPSADTPPASKDSTKDSEKTSAAPAPSAAGTGENSVYRISSDGAVREIFREKALMLSLAKHDGKLLVGTGMDGRLFEVDETAREYSEIARPDVGQILRMVKRADGTVVLCTGDAGHVLVMQGGVAPKGTVLSEVFDAKLISKWGTFSWRADLPEGASLSIAVRGGNTSEPDATWGDWSAEFTDPAKSVFPGPACHYAQYRLTLASADGKTTPVLHTVTLRYATANLAPEVISVETPDLDAAPAKEPKKVMVKWKATDPNEDELTFDVYVRKDGWADWVRIEEGFAKSEYEWDTTTTPSGVYRVRIVASDRADNAEGAALTGARESSPVVVAHEPPKVTVRVVTVENGKATLEATASAPLARLASATYAINGKKWESAFPTDGLFDAKEKTFRFITDGVAPGANVVVVRVKDVAGNVGTADVVFSSKK
jgi:hypothetical protein